MSIVHANNKTTISLGRQGENLARQVVFDLSDWVSGYGDGRAELIYQRPGDEQPYPVAAVRDGNTMVWNVTNVDTAVATAYGSYANCELRWYVGDVLAKSHMWRVYVETAMGTPAETAPPEPEQGWVERVLATGAAAQKAADAAKADADRAATLASDVAAKAAQTAQDATESAQAKEAAQTAQGLAEAAKQAAETAKQAAEAAQAAVAQSASDADAAKQGAESALEAAQSAASAAAQALSNIQELYQQVQIAGSEAKNAADRAESALKKAPKIQDGTWWTYDAQNQIYVDTGVKAEAKDGYTPQKGVDYRDGIDGKDGKSAYQSARDGGYTGAEEQFNSDLSAVGQKYEKPETGIPKSDLSDDVQTSLTKADSALSNGSGMATWRGGVLRIAGNEDDPDVPNDYGELFLGSSCIGVQLSPDYRNKEDVKGLQLKLGGYFWFVQGDCFLTGIKDGIDPNDAVNKAQLDEKIAAPATASVGQTIRVKTVDEAGRPTEWEATDELTQLKADIAKKITAPATASIGQTIRVKAVDESGKPTEWETFDLPLSVVDGKLCINYEKEEV